MLAQPTRRQHIAPQHALTIPPPSPAHSLDYAHSHLPAQFAAHHLFDQKLLNDYLDSQQQSYLQPSADSFMTSAYFVNPAIRVQQSTPAPQFSNAFTQPSMLPTAAQSSTRDAWTSFGNAQAQSLQTPSHNQQRGHQRASSSSSVGSGVSQYQPVAASNNYQSFSNHLPTPTHTPTQDSFMSQSFNNSFTQNTGGMDQTMAAHLSMKQALMEAQGEEAPDFAHSARQSVSSYGHDSPATPHTAQGEDGDFKMPVNDSRQQQPIVPKFERTYTDIAADNFYDPNAATVQITKNKPAQSSLLSPYRSNTNENVQRALQAAQYARSQSPTSTGSRGGDSPFRRGSPYRQPSSNFNSPMVGSASAAREKTRQADAAYAMKSQIQASDDSQIKTISPKDALLDFGDDHEDSKVSLFPDSGANEYDVQYNGSDQGRNAAQSGFDTTSGQGFRRDSWATPHFSPNFSTSAAPSMPTSTTFNFTAPSLQTIHTMPMAPASQYRTTPMSSAVEQTPEFPAHLTSMESSASEAEPNGSQSSLDRFLQKPVSSAADSGTYSCTYHGCTQRFETPQKLQKHKREGHRSANLGPSMTSAAMLDGNTQAGPHKCERINPTTGKPCNTIFSRPYDLTRHEDTIHNARKQKVRCALCVEEKTFSRNDALTRHMRVVHPEVDFPGKHRRRGGNHD